MENHLYFLLIAICLPCKDKIKFTKHGLQIRANNEVMKLHLSHDKIKTISSTLNFRDKSML